MKARTILLSGALLSGLLLASNAANAQANRVLSATVLFGQSGHYRIDWKTGAISTIHSQAMNAVHGMHGNAYELLARGIGGPILRTTLFNQLSTVVSISGPANAFAPDQDDAYWVANGGDRIGYLKGNSYSVRFRLRNANGANAICRDGDTGDIVVGCGDGSVLRLNRLGGNDRVVARGFGTISAIAWLPNGNFVIGRYDGTNGLVIIDKDGGTVRTIALPNVGAVVVDERMRYFYAATSDGVIRQFKQSGQQVFTRSFGTNMNFSGIDIRDSRQVSVSTTGRSGTTAKIAVHAPASRGNNYCLALSLARRPMMKFGNRNFWTMANDALFRISLCRGLPGSTGFSGQLHPLFSSANATLPIPSGLPAMTFFVGGAAANGAFPGGFEPFNVVPVVVR